MRDQFFVGFQLILVLIVGLIGNQFWFYPHSIPQKVPHFNQILFKTKRKRPNKSREQLVGTVATQSKEKYICEKKNEKLEEKIEDLTNILQKSEGKTDIIPSRKDGKFYTFALPNNLVRMRVKCYIAPARMTEAWLSSLDATFENSQDLSEVKEDSFPSESTIERISAAVAELAQLLEIKRFGKQNERFLSILFDGSTPYQKYNLFAVSAHGEKDGMMQETPNSGLGKVWKQ